LELHHIANQGLDNFPILRLTISGIIAQYSPKLAYDT